MGISNTLYVKKEKVQIYVGTEAGESCVKLWWNGGTDSTLEKVTEKEVIIVGIKDEKVQDFDYYYYIEIDNKQIEINKKNQEILYNLLKDEKGGK